MIPVNIITGFLGSGKTTLLKEILQKSEFNDTAVIVNEFGEVGLDHIILEEVEEGVLLLESGCICCTIRSDIQETIRSLQVKAAAGTIPSFKRLIIETTGLADPAPIVSTIAAEPIIRNHFRIGNIICTLDGIAGATTLNTHEEGTKQLAVADRILITKTDLVTLGKIKSLEKQAQGINPLAQIGHSNGTNFDVSLLFEEDINDPSKRVQEIERWFDSDRLADLKDHHHAHAQQHGLGLKSFVIAFDEPIDWTVFGIWLTSLLHAYGEKILRVKGLLNVEESSTPVILHGVQHIVHAPMHLERWPSEDRRSQIIFITKGISEDAIRTSLTTFLSLAKRMSGPEIPAVKD